MKNLEAGARFSDGLASPRTVPMQREEEGLTGE
jgi:hypothetical protein